MCSYNQTQISFYDPTELAIWSVLRPEMDYSSNCGHNFETKTVSFDDMAHFIHEKNIATYVGFDYGIIFYPGAPTDVGQNIENDKTFPDPVENHSASQKSITITIFLLEEHTSKISLNLYKL